MNRIVGLSRQRREIVDRIAGRRHSIGQRRNRLKRQVDAYLGTPRSVVHSFLAGFLMDQARPMVPDGPSPLKLILPWLVRELKLP